jgi:large subunit ribosomal protein L13Ae
MIHQKTKRGQEALSRLSTFEGIPEPYDKQKRVVVPCALRIMRLKPGRDFTIMGQLAHTVGWKHKDLLVKLESKRKAEAAEFSREEEGEGSIAKEGELLLLRMNSPKFRRFFQLTDFKQTKTNYKANQVFTIYVP